MPKSHVLVVEDEEDILELVSYQLRKEGYRVTQAMTGEAALQCAAREAPDLVILDLMLPGMDGLAVCRRLKQEPDTAMTPVMMLTAKGEESDIITGLELGADDYVTKPFSPRVLVARVRALLRRRERGETGADEVIHLDDLVIHPGRREVLVAGRGVDLTYTEFALLHLLARRPGWVFTRYQIVDAIHGEHYAVTERAVDVQVVGLRKKLAAAGDHIKTVRGMGYKFTE